MDPASCTAAARTLARLHALNKRRFTTLRGLMEVGVSLHVAGAMAFSGGRVGSFRGYEAIDHESRNQRQDCLNADEL